MNLILYIAYNFIIFSFIGWVIEEVYAIYITGEFQKYSFLNGPFKPMYGFTGAFIAYSYNIINLRGVPLVLILIFVPTIVEYISGYWLKRAFNKRYWSYENLKLNYNGFICLRFSIYWSILSLISIHTLIPMVTNIFINTKYFVIILVPLVLIYLSYDFIETVKLRLSKN